MAVAEINKIICTLKKKNDHCYLPPFRKPFKKETVKQSQIREAWLAVGVSRG